MNYSESTVNPFFSSSQNSDVGCGNTSISKAQKVAFKIWNAFDKAISIIDTFLVIAPHNDPAFRDQKRILPLFCVNVIFSILNHVRKSLLR